MLLGRHAGIGAGRVEKRDEWEPMPLRDLHQPHALSVPLRMGHAEVALLALFEVAALLLADQRDRPALEAPEPRDERGIFRTSAIAVQLDEVLQQALDVVEGVRTLRVTRELDQPPDLFVGGLLLDAIELSLKTLDLAGKTSATKEWQAPQAAQPLAEMDLVLTGHWQRVAGRGRRTA